MRAILALAMELAIEMPDPGQVLTKALLGASQRLSLSQRDLAHAVGVSEATVSRWFKGIASVNPAGKEGELGLLLIRAFRSLDALVGGDERHVKAWMREQNHDLQAAPIELVRRAEGLVHVVDYLDAMRGKL